MFTLRFLVSLLTLILFVPVFAQAPDVVYNLPLLGQSFLFFSGTLAGLTEVLKNRAKKLYPSIPDLAIQIATLFLGVGAAALINQQNLLLDPLFASLPSPVNWLSYGLVGGGLAIGGYEFVTGIAAIFAGKKIGGKVITVPAEPPTPKEAEKQIDAVPGIIASTLRTFALSQGIPAFMVDMILALAPIELATAMIHDAIARKRSLTPEEVAVDQLAWAQANPVTEEELEAAKERLKARQSR